MLFSAIRIQLCKRKRWIQACWKNMQNDTFTSEVTLPQLSFKWILLILNNLLWLPAKAPLLFSCGYLSGLWDTLWEVRPCSINKTSSENEGVNRLSHIGCDRRGPPLSKNLSHCALIPPNLFNNWCILYHITFSSDTTWSQSFGGHPLYELNMLSSQPSEGACSGLLRW